MVDILVAGADMLLSRMHWRCCCGGVCVDVRCGVEQR